MLVFLENLRRYLMDDPYKVLSMFLMFLFQKDVNSNSRKVTLLQLGLSYFKKLPARHNLLVTFLGKFQNFHTLKDVKRKKSYTLYDNKNTQLNESFSLETILV